MKFSYYPGCTLKTQGKDLDIYARKSAEALGIDMEEIENWQCCGAVYPQAKDEIARKLSAVRALDSAKKQDGKLLTLCSACYNVIKRVNNDMKNDENINLKANNYLKATGYLAEGEEYNGETEVIHYLEMLRDTVGWANLKAKVVNPLKGVKIGAYYGCLLLRPSSVLQFDNPENPTILEDFIKAIGATPVVYAMRNECCGAYVSLKDKEVVKKTANRIVNNAKANGADMLITACPACWYNLNHNSDGSLPVKYLTELLAQALGLI